MTEIKCQYDLLSLKVGDILFVDGSASEAMNSGAFLITEIMRYETGLTLTFSSVGNVKIFTSPVLSNNLSVTISEEKGKNSLFNILDFHKVRFFREEN